MRGMNRICSFEGGGKDGSEPTVVETDGAGLGRPVLRVQ